MTQIQPVLVSSPPIAANQPPRLYYRSFWRHSFTASVDSWMFLPLGIYRLTLVFILLSQVLIEPLCISNPHWVRSSYHNHPYRKSPLILGYSMGHYIGYKLGALESNILILSNQLLPWLWGMKQSWHICLKTRPTPSTEAMGLVISLGIYRYS